MGGYATPVMMGASAVGTVVDALGSIREGQAQKDLANQQAAGMRIQAGQERATSQRDAFDARRQATLAVSRAKAVSAASGGSASDPTVVNLEAGIGARGEYNALTALYSGEEKAKALNYQARIAKYGGQQAETAGFGKAFDTVLGGATSLYTNYGQGLFR